MLRDPAYRDAIRFSVENPNRDGSRGSTTPPPQFSMLKVNRTRDAVNAKWNGVGLPEMAKALGCAPMDALVDLALAEDLETEFLWDWDSPEWRDGTELASRHPQMLIGTSDGGAHLGRDDGAEFSSFFLAKWVREWGRWELEAAVRELSAIPAAVLGFSDRGLLLPGLAADVVIFDPETVGPDRKSIGEDRIPGQRRWASRPKGIHATIVNGVPIVLEGEIADEAARPGQIVRPGVRI